MPQSSALPLTPLCPRIPLVLLVLGVLWLRPAAPAGVVVTRTRQVQLGAASELENGVAVRSEFGAITFSSDKIAWYSLDPHIDSLYKAGIAAEGAGKDMVALYLFRLSHERETGFRERAAAAMKTIRERHTPSPHTPATPTVASEAPAPPRPANRPRNDVLPELKGDLVRLKNGRRLSRVHNDELPDVDYYAVYFSAHWCPPCRAFTPQLVNFYNDLQAEKPDAFELIFISSDNSEGEMAAYMTETAMPWPAIRYSAARKTALRRYAGQGIPCLVVIDRGGNVLSHSMRDGGNRMTVMDALKRLVTEPSS